MNQPKRLQPSQSKIRPGHWALFFALIGFGLRLQKLSLQPLWGDEGWSFYFAAQPLPQLLALTAIDIHPPLYYMLLKGWLAVIGVGAEEARFFSVVTGTLLIPILGVIGQQLFDKRVGAIAAATAAVMPMAVYYSQEVRMYGLVALLGATSVYFFIKSEETSHRNFWQVGYIVTTVAALYTMYYAVFIIFFQGLYILLTRLRQPGRLLRRLPPLVYVGLLYLPWVFYAAPRLVNYIENKRDVEGYVPLTFIRFLGDHFIAFSLGHLPTHLQNYGWIALAMGIVALLGIAGSLYPGNQNDECGMMNDESRKNSSFIYLLLYLFVPMLIGYLINQFYPFTPQFFERTLLLAAPAYWLFIAAGVIWLWDRQYLLVGTAVMAMLLAISVSLISFYTLPRYPDEDYRPLLQDIAARTTPDDTVLASYQWQLGFYQAYLPPPRPKLFAVPGWGQGWASQTAKTSSLTVDLTDILAQSPRLWFPAYQAGGHIWEDEAEAAIATLGYPALLQWYSPQTKLTLAGAAQTPLRQISAANFENRLTLLEATVGGEKYQAGRGIVPVQLIWQKEDNLGSEHRVSLRLVDATGRTWATRDSHPRAGQAFFTDMAIGDTLTDRHGLLTPAGASPGNYRLMLAARRVDNDHPLDLLDEAGQPLGAELLLAEVTLIAPNPPVGAAALPVQVAMGDVFGQQARLVGYSLGQGPFKAGLSLPLTLFWESLVDNPGPLVVLVELKDAAGETVVSHRQEPVWPATEWRQGAILLDPHDVALPPALAPGEYRLSISLLTPEQGNLAVNGQKQLSLTTVTTIDRPHIFEAPNPEIDLAVNFGEQARLVGLDLPRTQVKAGQSVKFALYWQAIAPLDKSWTVFVHLTDSEGKIISQQDQIPGGGRFPTTGWLPGEYLVDSYNLLIPSNAPPGQKYRLKIGLYDANDFIRLPVVEAGQIVNDHITLESWPISVE